MEPLTIYDELIDMVEVAEHLADLGHHAEALVQLTLIRSAITAHLDGVAH